MATLSSTPPPSSHWQNPNPNHNFALNPSSLLDQTQTLDTDSSTTMQTPPPEPSPPATLHHLSFNQDSACFVAATDSDFRVLGSDPFRELFRREFAAGGIGLAEMLFQSNVIALVGGGSRPQFPLNKLMVWDDHQGRCFGELSFRSPVRGVRLRRDRIIVALEMKVFVYNFLDFKLLHQAETIANPKGLCVVSQNADSVVMACPGLHRGQVRVEHYAKRKTHFISAHDSSLAFLALTLDGKFLASASTKGTLIRIFDTANSELLQEVRRGANAAEIYSLAFSSTAQWLAVSSDKGTVHIFSLKVNSGVAEHEKSQSLSNSYVASKPYSSSFPFIKFKGVLPKYFSSEWSVAQFRLKERSHSIVAFGPQKNTVIILGMDGSFYRCQFDPVNGGEMTRLEYHNFLNPETAAS